MTQGAMACILDVIEGHTLYNLTGGEPCASSPLRLSPCQTRVFCHMEGC